MFGCTSTSPGGGLDFAGVPINSFLEPNSLSRSSSLPECTCGVSLTFRSFDNLTIRGKSYQTNVRTEDIPRSASGETVEVRLRLLARDVREFHIRVADYQPVLGRLHHEAVVVQPADERLRLSLRTRPAQTDRDQA